VSCTELIGELVQARAKGEWEKALAGYLTPEVLVVDEVGYLNYGPYAANVLFPVVDKRYLHGQRPLLLTTNKEPQQWGRCSTMRICRRQSWTACCTGARS
jgi:DNA replication protein DnaC